MVLIAAVLSAALWGCAGQTSPPANPANSGGGANTGLRNGSVTPAPGAGSAAKDVVALVGIRANAQVGQPFEATWRVNPSGTDDRVTQTYLHYDWVSHPGDFGTAVTAADGGYQEITTNFAKTSQPLPQEFSVRVPVSRAGTLYLRAHAVVGGKHYWTAEHAVTAVSIPDGLGGRTTPQPDPSREPEAFGMAFSLTAKNWEFSPAVLRVKKGNTVVITITNAEGTHGFALPDFGIDQKLEPGQSVTVKFVANKSGQFTFFCNVPCGSGHQKMKGTLIVVP